MAGAFVASLKGPDFRDRDQRMAYLILVACIPAGVGSLVPELLRGGGALALARRVQPGAGWRALHRG